MGFSDTSTGQRETMGARSGGSHLPRRAYHRCLFTLSVAIFTQGHWMRATLPCLCLLADLAYNTVALRASMSQSREDTRVVCRCPVMLASTGSPGYPYPTDGQTNGGDTAATHVGSLIRFSSSICSRPRSGGLPSACQAAADALPPLNACHSRPQCLASQPHVLRPDFFHLRAWPDHLTCTDDDLPGVLHPDMTRLPYMRVQRHNACRIAGHR